MEHHGDFQDSPVKQNIEDSSFCYSQLASNGANAMADPPMDDPADPLRTVMLQKGVNPDNPAINIVVHKVPHTLILYSRGIYLKSYPVELGEGGLEDKVRMGDKKTPEGTFYICQKTVFNPPDRFLGSRWLRLSYPNIEDAARGLRDGLINLATYNAIVNAINAGKTPPQYSALGGGIGIHGGNTPDKGKNWTYGCIALKDQDIEEFYKYFYVGTNVRVLHN